MVTAGLLAYVLASGSIGIRVLRRARWLTAVPRAGAVAWLVLSASIPAALLAAAFSALTATTPGHSLADLVHACLLAFRSVVTGSVTPAWATLLGVALVAVGMGTPALFVVELRRGHVARQAQRAMLQIVGVRSVLHQDLVVVRHPEPVAYCLPGRRRAIVVTTGALATLEADELAAVLAHERAHLRGRHHLALAWTGAVARSLPFLPDLRRVAGEQRQLLEMAADDRAARASTPQAVARAITRLVGPPLAGEVLGAADLAVVARVERLLAPGAPTRRGRARGLLLAASLAALPLGFVSLVGVAAASAAHCPID